jgi:hypothetical protein
MESVLVIRHAAYADSASAPGTPIGSVAQLDDLHEGAVVIVTPNGTVIPETGFGANVEPYFQIVLKTAGGGFIRTPLIERDTFSYLTRLHKAGQKKVMQIDFAGAALTVGKSAGVNITPGTEVITFPFGDYEDFNVPVLAGESVDDVVAKLAALISRKSELVSASAATSVITLTGKEITSFNVVGTYEFLTYSTNVVTPYQAPWGVYEQIKNLELKGSAHKGNMRSYSLTYEMYKQPLQTETGVDYNTVNVSWKKIKYDALNSNDEPYNQQGLLATGDTALITIFETIFDTV